MLCVINNEEITMKKYRLPKKYLSLVHYYYYIAYIIHRRYIFTSENREITQTEK